MAQPMDPQAMPQGGAPDAGAPAPEQGAPEAESSNPATEALFGINDALTQVQSGLADDPKVPPEALDELRSAVEAYGRFLSIYGQSIGADMPEGLPSRKNQSMAGQGNDMAQGNPRAVPAN